MAGIAGDMVGGRNSVTRLVAFNAIPHRHHLSPNFMPQHQRRPAATVPLHNVTAANTAGHNPYQHLARPYLQYGHFFNTNIGIGIVHRDTHGIKSSDISLN
jgi:hypothetical protein